MYCHWRSKYQEGRVWIPLTGLTSPHFFACLVEQLLKVNVFCDTYVDDFVNSKSYFGLEGHNLELTAIHKNNKHIIMKYTVMKTNSKEWW
jgi:hypothetical protein